MATSSNKVIAKNTIYLYLRTIAILFVSLYTSRLVLQVLGVIDLGIYNVVGGIVALITFLQSAQTRATTRFLAYDLGENKDDSNQQVVFSRCMTIHVIIAMISLIIAETIGLWIVNCLTNIPEDRMVAANYVYQFSVLTLIANIIRVPYDSAIIAREKMDVYAYMSILEIFLQLTVVFLLSHLSGDKLIIYGLLCFFSSFVMLSSYYLYVNRTYSVYKFRWRWDTKESRQILNFSGWTLLGGGANTLTQQGVSLLLNNYVGLVANTALGFANQVNVAVSKFVNNFATAFNPPLIKLYASNDKEQLFPLINRASKFSFVLCYIMALPLIYNMPFVLGIWLPEVPQYTVDFCRLILVCSIIDATTGVFNTAITATGNIRGFQIGISISFLLDLLCVFFLLTQRISPSIVFGSRILTRGIANMLIELYFVRKQLSFDVIKYVKNVLGPCILTAVIPIVFLICFLHTENPLVQFIISTTSCVLIIVLCTWFFIMNKTEKKSLMKIITLKFRTK